MMDIKMNHMEGINKGRVILYALSTCQWCKKVRELLRELNIDYYYVDVDLASENDQEEIMEEIKKYNPACSFPTLILDDNDSIIGFNEEKIRERFE
jgi:glutaredoxin-like protein NrdH